MTFLPADFNSLALFVALVTLLLFVILFAMKKSGAHLKWILGFLIYLIIFSSLVGSGQAEMHVIPVVPILFGSVFLFSIVFTFSSAGEKMAQFFSLPALVGFQAFRLPLELILHHWAGIGTIPKTMTWTGQNWDILTGVLAITMIPLVQRAPKVAWIFQIVGSVLLLNVLRVVLMSSPFPFSWPLENPLQVITHFPYALIGPLCVGPAIAGHLILFRKLRN